MWSTSAIVGYRLKFRGQQVERFRFVEVMFGHLTVVLAFVHPFGPFAHMAMGQYAEAEPLFQRSLKIREASLGADWPRTYPKWRWPETA